MPVRFQKPVRRASVATVGWTLMIIDHRRLQGAAWAEFHAARKRLEKATRDLHRHENVDVPEYEAWLYRTFPTLLTALRNLQAELEPKAAKVREVQARAAIFGGSLKRIWRDLKVREAKRAAAEDDDEFDEDSEDRANARRSAFDREDDDDWPGGESARSFERPSGPEPTAVARDIYRRLVQRLHPDRGGDWTPARERLWHEVQNAWAAADADWLARLEVEWETANEILGPTSPLSRLRLAIEELHAARRDTERKLREYRRAPAWRFTKNEKKRPLLRQSVERNLRLDFDFLQDQLRYLNETIAAWEEDWTRTSSRSRRR